MINKNMNLEYEYKFYTDDDVTNYIKDNFPEYIKAYDKLIPGAYKADLFRYLVLYKEGGVYMDCKSSTIFPLRDFINPDIGFISFKDRLPGTIQISFIASIAAHPILKKCIDLTISNIINERYGINFLDITGPQVCGRVFNSLLKRPELNQIEEDIFKEIDTEIIGSFVTIGNNMYEILADKKLKPLISRACGSYANKKISTNNYGVRWQTRTVYN
jgi:mannosyltransferase OCH1-like enzyme